MGGGTMQLYLPKIQLGTSSSNHPSQVSSSALSNLNFPASANYNSPLKQSSNASSCSCNSDTCKRVEKEDKIVIGPIDNSVFASVPSKFEVENAIATLQSFMHGISSSGPEMQRLQPDLGSSDPRILISQGYGRGYDIFRLLRTDPSIKRLVASLASDKAVWDAVVNNELVRKLRESSYPAETGRHQSSDGEPNLTREILRWILDIAKAKILELVQNFQALLNEVFYHLDKEKPKEETRGNLEEKVKSSLLLSIVILLIVVMARVHRV